MREIGSYFLKSFTHLIERKRTGVASDVFKVEGAESGHPRSPDLRNDTRTAISPLLGQQNKASHTL